MKITDTPNQLDKKNKVFKKIISFNQTNVVNVQLKVNEEISTHKVDCDVLVVVRTGKILFTVEGQEVELTNENVLHMTPLEIHSLKAIVDSDLLVIKITK